MKPSDDEGSTLPLIIFFGMLSMVLVLIVVAASSLYLERKRLFTLADSAALVGAEAFELTAVAPASGGVRPQLTSGDVRAEVTDFIESTPNRFEALQVERAETIFSRPLPAWLPLRCWPAAPLRLCSRACLRSR